MQQKYFYCLIFISFLLLPNFVHAEDTQWSFRVGKKKITVILEQKDWDHIFFGQEIEDGFLGGHDWAHYFEHHLKNIPGAQASFDQKEFYYLAHSKKGEKLSDILHKIANNKNARYHTLFPPGVLDKNFIFDTFREAFRLKQTNYENGSFWAEIEKDGTKFKVAGYFERNKGKYYIKTLFPNLSSFYRPQPDDNIGLSRFFLWNPQKQIWERHGESLLNIALTSNKHWPSPLQDIGPKLSTSQKLSPASLSTQLEIQEFLSAKLDDSKIDSIALFFRNPENPTKHEFQNMLQALKIFLPKFKIAIDKKKSVAQKLKNLRFQLNKYLNSANPTFKRLIVRLDQCSYSSLLLKNEHNIGDSHFGEQLIKQMLMINLQTIIKPTFSIPGAEQLTSIAKNFAANFSHFLLDDEILYQRFENSEIAFFICLMPGVEHNYILSLISLKDLRQEDLLSQNAEFRPLFGFKGEDFLHVHLGPFPKARDIGYGLEFLRKLHVYEQKEALKIQSKQALRESNFHRACGLSGTISTIASILSLTPLFPLKLSSTRDKITGEVAFLS